MCLTPPRSVGAGYVKAYQETYEQGKRLKDLTLAEDIYGFSSVDLIVNILIVFAVAMVAILVVGLAVSMRKILTSPRTSAANLTP